MLSRKVLFVDKLSFESCGLAFNFFQSNLKYQFPATNVSICLPLMSHFISTDFQFKPNVSPKISRDRFCDVFHQSLKCSL